MNIRKKLQAALLAARIEYHWWFILRGRKLGERWLRGCEPLNSPRMLRLNRRIDRHGLTARRCEARYEALFVTAAGKA